jgi:hypothetical protein
VKHSTLNRGKPGSIPGRRTDRHSMPIRPTGRTAQSDCADRGSNPRWAAMPPRTAAVPLSYSGRPGSAPGGGSTCSYSNRGREGGLRSRQLRVRLPPSTPSKNPGADRRSKRWWRNWQPRTPQERVSSDVRVRLPPSARKVNLALSRPGRRVGTVWGHRGVDWSWYQPGLILPVTRVRIPPPLPIGCRPTAGPLTVNQLIGVRLPHRVRRSWCSGEPG